MACLVNRDNGKIVSVETPDGKQSKLFKAIHSIPFLSGTETSLNAYKNAYSNKAEKMFEGAESNVYDTGEPILYIRGKKGQYDSVEEAVIADERGQLEAGFKNPKTNEFIPIINFKTDSNERGEFIFESIQQGFLSAERVLDEKGDTYFEGKGKNITDKMMGARATKFEAYTNGNARVKIHQNGKLTIPNTDSVSRIEFADGTVKYVKPENILDEIKDKEVKNKADLLFDYAILVKKVVPATSGEIRENKKEEKDLQSSLMNFLRTLGFSASSLESYRNRYNNIHGNDPDVQALADMANKIVAFREGNIGVEDLSEEVAHIAIEFYSDQESIASALSVVHLTQEYADYAEYYRSKYKSQLKDDVALEEMVRKEVLGKILKNELADGFSTENKSEERIGIIENLRGYWAAFVEFLGFNVNRRHINAIKKLNTKISNSVLTGDIQAFNLNTKSDSVYYNATSSESKIAISKLQKGKKLLEELYKKESGTAVPNKTELDRISSEMDIYQIFSTAATLVGVSKQQSSILVKSLERAEKEGLPASIQDIMRKSFIETSRNNFQGMLDGFKSMDLDSDPRLKTVRDNIVSQFQEIDSNMSKADPLLRRNDTRTQNKIIDSAIEDAGVTEQEAEKIKSNWNSVKQDTSFAGEFFGLMSESKNSVLALMAKLIKDMYTSVEMAFLNTANPFISDTEEKGQTALQRNIIKRVNGKGTHYYLGPVNRTKFDERLSEEQVKLIKELNPEMEVSEIEEKLRTEPAYALLDKSKQDEYAKRYKEVQQGLTEQFFNKEYKEKKEARYKKAFVSDATKETISNKNTARFKRNKKYLDEEGNVDNSLKTEDDKAADQFDRANYKAVLSPYSNGHLRLGLTLIDMSEVSDQERQMISNVLPYNIDSDYKGEIVVPSDIFFKDNGRYKIIESVKTPEDYGNRLEEIGLNEDSRISLDLNTLNMTYRQELADGDKASGYSSQFFEKLDKVVSEGGSAYDFAVSNGTMTFTSDYYDLMSSQEFVGYVEAAQKMIRDIDDADLTERYNKRLSAMKELMSEKKAISKIYRKENNPMEPDVSSMPISVKKRLIQIDTELGYIRSDLRVDKSYFSDSVNEISDRVLIQDFYDDANAEGLSEYEYARKHMTPNNELMVIEFHSEYYKYLNGYSVSMKKSFEEFASKKEKELGLSNATAEEKHEAVVNAYATSKVASYYTKSEPKGTTAFLKKLSKPGNEAELKKFLQRDPQFLEENEVAKYVEIAPDYTWSSEVSDNDSKNKRYMKDEFYLQPKLVDDNGQPTEFVDKEFFEKYGIDMKKWLSNPHLDMDRMEPTTNLNEFDFLRKVIKLREEGLKSYNVSESVSKFQRSQMSVTKAEKAIDTMKGKNWKANLVDSWRDFFRVRADEKEYGEVTDTKTLNERGEQINVKVIPRYFIDKLENPDIVTENVMQSELMMFKQASLYKARNQHAADVTALLRKVETDEIMTSGVGGKKGKIEVKGQNSGLYRKADEYVNAHVFGINQSRRMQATILGKNIDLTKAISKIQAITRFGNLAFHPIIDITSFTTGQTVLWSDRYAGDYYHKSSFDRALRDTPKVFKYISESGKLHKQSELNHLLELFGVETIDERVADSAQSRGIRLASKSPFGLAKVSNMGIKPQVMNSILYDMRYIDGKFQGWEQYYNTRKSQDKTLSKKDIELDFKNAENDSLFDHLEITKDGITFNDKFKERFGEESSTEFQKVVQRATSKIESLVQKVDTVISKTDRLKAQRDIIGNQFTMHKGWLPIGLTKRFKGEHFNFVTGRVEQGHYHAVFDLVKEVFKNKGSFKAMSDIIKEMSPHKRANLRRVVFETGLVSSLILGAMALFSADDDDDSYIEDVIQLAYLRTLREFSASTAFGMGKSVVETLKSPITAISTLENLEPITLIKSTGSLFLLDYEPMWKTVKSLTPLKRFGQLGDIQQQINSYFHFNRLTIPFDHPIKAERKRQKELREAMREEAKELAEAQRTWIGM